MQQYQHGSDARIGEDLDMCSGPLSIGGSRGGHCQSRFYFMLNLEESQHQSIYI